MKGGIWVANALSRSPRITTAANLPLANSVAVGTQFRVSDWGIAPGLVVVSDGTYWVPAHRQMIANGFADINSPDDLTEDTLVTVSLPPVFGSTHRLIILSTWNCTSSANNKNIRHRVSGNVLANFAVTANANNECNFELSANGATNAQRFVTKINAQPFSAANALAVDLSVAQPLTITSQKSLLGELITLQSYKIEVE